MLMLKQYVPIRAYKPRLYLNGFPKAGIHLLCQMVEPLLTATTIGTNGTAWCGTFAYHSWTNERLPLRPILWRMSCLPRGEFMMGHCGYHQDIDRLFYFANIGHIFLYRDPRAVAVSQAHHILDEDKPSLMHPHKDFFKMFKSFKATLGAVIKGIGPYPGVIARWVEYAPWLDAPHVLKLKYEDLISQPEASAKTIIDFALNNATELLDGNDGKIEATEETYQELTRLMLESASNTKASVTYREGKIDGWRKEFDDDLYRLFRECDPDNWVEKLGYTD